MIEAYLYTQTDFLNCKEVNAVTLVSCKVDKQEGV